VSEQNESSKTPATPTRNQAAEALRRARKLPVGANRNDLRQLAMGLLWLDRHQFGNNWRETAYLEKLPSARKTGSEEVTPPGPIE
jgi:hypothetical protein